jgi:YjjG family noncanonical pyrimidine nucleotidase
MHRVGELSSAGAAGTSRSTSGVSSCAYTTVLLDLDHTLLDSDASEALAFGQALRQSGIGQPERHFATYDAINRALWAAVEREEITPSSVRTARFEQLVATTGIDADPLALADSFVDGLSTHGELYPGAHDVLDALARLASLALVTNGLSEVQRRRIERLDLGKYFDAVVISSEVGASKPSSEIFDITFEMLAKPAKATVLMVGDSLTSDIQGGANYGIATCWYNPRRLSAGPLDTVDHDIDSLNHLPGIVTGHSPLPRRRCVHGVRGESDEND